MFPIAGQTAGPIGLKFFVDTHGWPGVSQAKKIEIFFFPKLFFTRATPGPSAGMFIKMYNIYLHVYTKRENVRYTHAI